MICGDLNARTGSKADCIVDDEVCNVQQFEYDFDNSRLRHSQDNVNCSRGKSILETCISAKLRIVNGRKLGDSLGRFTCHKNVTCEDQTLAKKCGSSVVDYLIVEENILDEITSFKVNDYLGHISDHCSLSWAIITPSKHKIGSNQYNSSQQYNSSLYAKFPIHFKWDNNLIGKYQLHLNSEINRSKLKDLLNNATTTRPDIDTFTAELTNILIESAKASLPLKSRKRKSNKSKSWFDNQLRDLKKSVSFLASLLQNNPYNTQLRKSYFETLTKYNKLRKKKARSFKAKLFQELNEARESNPTFYWKLLNRLRENFTDSKAEKIKIYEWEDYFKKLNMSSINNDKIKEQLEHLEKVKHFDKTDFKIKEQEVMNCIKLLKNKKAAGLDGVLNEMIKHSTSSLLPTYTKLFNDILLCGYYPDQWKEGYITPIYKKGNEYDTNNYRGITIMSNLAKLFNMVIQSRVFNFFKENNLISDLQIGFKPDSRTTDHIHTVKTLIDKYTKNGKKLYSCFIDFKKAFDRVNRWKLLYKLRQTNIGTLSYNIIKDMYLAKKDHLQVKIGDHLSNKFASNIGVKQGDCLSPILFNFYIDEVVKYITPDKNTPYLGNTSIPLLLYADDLVIFSTSKNSLQSYLNSMAKYCAEWDMEINTEKTKIIIFGNYRKSVSEEFTFKNNIIEIVQSYKYLGVTFQRNGDFNDCVKDLYNKSIKAMFKLMKTFKCHRPDFNTCIHLFDHLIKPILTYGAEIWGPTTLKGKGIDFKKFIQSLFEKCHQKFLRYALGVNKRVPLIGLYGETGRFPLNIEMLISGLKYSSRLKKSKNNILNSCWLENQNNLHKKSWYSNLGDILLFCNQLRATPNINLVAIKNNIQIEFKTWWFSQLYDDNTTKSEYGNKLRSYRTYKNIFKKEDYLNITNRAHMSTFAQLRLSCHKLQIETGRYLPKKDRLAPHLRICKMCNLDKCENELHFVIHCPYYKEEREAFLIEFEKLTPLIKIRDLPEENLFIYFMANVDPKILGLFTKFIHTIYSKRLQKVQ